MNKRKAIAVTVVMALMLAAIVVGLYKIDYRACRVAVIILAAYGFLCGTASFGRWLMQEAPMLPAADRPERRSLRDGAKHSRPVQWMR